MAGFVEQLPVIVVAIAGVIGTVVSPIIAAKRSHESQVRVNLQTRRFEVYPQLYAHLTELSDIKDHSAFYDKIMTIKTWETELGGLLITDKTVHLITDLIETANNIPKDEFSSQFDRVSKKINSIKVGLRYDLGNAWR